LDCEKGCNLYSPDVVQCYNKGFDGTDVNWRCETELPTEISLYDTIVGCEGYSYPEDPYILKGSCQLSYSLKSSGHSQQSSHHSNSRQYYPPKSAYRDSSANSYNNPFTNTYNSFPHLPSRPSIKSMLFWGAIIYFVWRFFFKSAKVHPHHAAGNPVNNPYQQQSAHPAGGFFNNMFSGYNNGAGGFFNHNQKPPPPSKGGFGFWSGMGLGGLLGSWYSKRGQGQNQGYGAPPAAGYNGPSGFGPIPTAGAGGYAANSPAHARGHGHPQGASDSDRDSPTTRTATSYATTRRR
jgi:hypothetical protein